jgi:PAS domain S-box-containing protein
MRRTLTPTMGLVAVIAIFGVDLRLVPASSIAILYVPIILLGLRLSWKPYPAVVAALASTFLIGDRLLAPLPAGTAVTPLAIADLVTIVVFAATAALVASYTRLERRSSVSLEQLEDLKRAIDHAAIVATTDVTGRIISVNDKFCEISKYSREELIGQDHRIINSQYHSKAFIRDLWRTIANGHVWHGEIRNRAKDGSFYWVDTTIVPFLDSRGKPYQYIAIRADITALKAAETRLVQQAALAHLGQMAAVVAHEVRNPLAGIKGALQILIGRRTPGDAELPIMREVIARIDALGELINDVMVFARPRALRPTEFSIRPLVLDAIAMLRRDPIGSAVEATVDGPDFAVTGDQELLKAATLNLLLNAAQAMHGRGPIAITLSRQRDRAVLDIRDSGPGIPPELREHVFEPFFTTKSRGGGLGLPIARRTAELHGGSLTFECPDTGGTHFTLSLPLRGVAGDEDGGAGTPPTVATVRTRSR